MAKHVSSNHIIGINKSQISPILRHILGWGIFLELSPIKENKKNDSTLQALKNYLIYINEVYRSMKMKVLLLNGSPHQHGCTYTALNEIAEELKKNNIESDFFYVGTEAIKPVWPARLAPNSGNVW